MASGPIRLAGTASAKSYRPMPHRGPSCLARARVGVSDRGGVPSASTAHRISPSPIRREPSPDLRGHRDVPVDVELTGPSRTIWLSTSATAPPRLQHGLQHRDSLDVENGMVMAFSARRAAVCKTVIHRFESGRRLSRIDAGFPANGGVLGSWAPAPGVRSRPLKTARNVGGLSRNCPALPPPR